MSSAWWNDIMWWKHNIGNYLGNADFKSLLQKYKKLTFTFLTFLQKMKAIKVVEVIYQDCIIDMKGAVSRRLPPQKDQIHQISIWKKMIKLAWLFFLLFSTVSPKPLLFSKNKSSSSSMVMEEANNKNSPVAFHQRFMETNPTLVFILITVLPGLLIIVEIILVPDVPPNDTPKDPEVLSKDPSVLPKDMAGCVNQGYLPIQCNANYWKKTVVEVCFGNSAIWESVHVRLFFSLITT